MGIQIHELDSFTGELSENTVLAIDDGTETMKLPATELIQPLPQVGVIVLNRSAAFSTLPLTIIDERITTDMMASKLVLSNQSAQAGEWTFNTDTAGQVVVTGVISGSTTIEELWLERIMQGG